MSLTLVGKAQDKDHEYVINQPMGVCSSVWWGGSVTTLVKGVA